MKLNVIKNRYKYFWVSALVLMVSFFYFLFSDINYWIDMTWWTNTIYTYKIESLETEKIEKELIEKSKNVEYNGKNMINSISVIKIFGKNEISVTVWYNKVSLKKEDLEVLENDKKITETKISGEILSKIKQDFREKTLNILKKYDEKLEESLYTNIWKSFWDYIRNTAILTLAIAIIAISIYIMYAFFWVAWWIWISSFAIITIVTLFHDILISTWLYLIVSSFLPEFRIDTFFVTALLTILGYSINDTIVVSDRIRSNIKKLVKSKNLEEIIEISVSETLRRSIFTSLTLFFVLLTIFLFWPETIKGFILTMMFGTIIWTYSSIFIASPLLYELNKNKKLSEYKETIVKPEDKVVV